MFDIFKGNKESATKANAHDPLVAFDIGTSKIRLISGEVEENGKVKVTYYKEILSQGIVNGAVSDLSKLSDCLSTLIQCYKNDLNKPLTHCIIGISGRHIESHNETGNATVPTHRVTEADRAAAVMHASAVKFSELNHLIHILPQSYEIDNSKDISNPIGLSAMRLGVGVHLIACNEDQENNLRAALEMVSPNIVVDHVIYNGLAAAEAVLTGGEKDIGVCLIDIGSGTINMSIYDSGKLVMTFGFEGGGGFHTKELAVKYGLPIRTAEYIKTNYGVAYSSLLTEEEGSSCVTIKIHDKEILLERRQLAKEIFYLLVDSFRRIDNKINNYVRDIGSVTLGAGYVLTGGVAKTPGIDNVMSVSDIGGQESQNTKVKVRVAYPNNVDFNQYEEYLNTPEAATAIGLLRFAHAEDQKGIHQQCLVKERRSSEGVFARCSRWVKDWLSSEF